MLLSILRNMWMTILLALQLIDSVCKPYIIEINHNPSFKLPTELDVQIKTAALAGCLGIVCDKFMPLHEMTCLSAKLPSQPAAAGAGAAERASTADGHEEAAGSPGGSSGGATGQGPNGSNAAARSPGRAEE